MLYSRKQTVNEFKTTACDDLATLHPFANAFRAELQEARLAKRVGFYNPGKNLGICGNAFIHVSKAIRQDFHDVQREEWGLLDKVEKGSWM